MTKAIYFDESGFTGYNYLDADQPIFIIASTDLNPDLAKKILNESFPKYKGNEYKFKNLWNSSQKTGFITLFSKIQELSITVYAYMIDKKFSTLAKMVDFLIEPTVTKAGYDFYADGFCWKYANYIYFGLTQLEKPHVIDEIVVAYQTFSRNPSMDEWVKMKTVLKYWSIHAIEQKNRLLLSELAEGASVLPVFSDIDSFKDTNEFQLSTMVAIVAWWRQHFSEDFIVVHDATANFSRQKETWEAITRSDVPRQLHPLGDGSTVEFPLRVVDTQSVDSKDNYSVQFCDVVAGLCTRNFDKRVIGEDRDMINACIDKGLGNVSYNGIKFRPIFPTFPPQKLLGPDAVSLMTRIISKS